MSANTIMKEFMQPPLQSIDKIARVKQRDVLLVSFIEHITTIDDLCGNAAQQKLFAEVTAWLDANGIKWQQCALMADHATWGYIYVDVLINEADCLYQKLINYLTHADGSTSIKGVTHAVISLENSMKYSHEDEHLELGLFEKYWRV